MVNADERSSRISEIVETITRIGRELALPRGTPFGDVQLTRTQQDALIHLAHDRRPTTPGGLAVALDVTAGAVTQSLGGLRSAGLVEQHVHPDDARTRVLALTQEAREHVRAYEADQAERLAPRFEALTDRELERLRELLAKALGDVAASQG